MSVLFRRALVSAHAAMCILALLPGLSLALSQDSKPSDPVDSRPLTLQAALAETLLHSPNLQAYSLEIRAREAEVLQAGLRPNPLLSLEVENLLGSGEFTGTDAAETTLSLTQTIELGGKRSLRRELAKTEQLLARNDYSIAEADALAATSADFVAVLVTQRRLELMNHLVELARQVEDNLRERIAAGKAAETEVLRIFIQRRELEAARDKTGRELSAAREKLAAGLGRQRADFGAVAGDPTILVAPPSLEQIEKLVESSPLLRRRAAESERRQKVVRLEQARRYSDLDIEVGARYLRPEEDVALVVGVSVPLPLFDRNQGNIAAARQRLAQARDEERDALLQTRAAVFAAWQGMQSAREDIGALTRDILPAAGKALEAMEYGYHAGKFSLLDVLDAQRTLVEARGAHLDALASFHGAAAELDRLLGPEWRALNDKPLTSVFIEE
ncbi:TolC family protein [Geoalkalibacter sp.]|uniref:TolC family protein n=1 Tax=Geoalkalibacter sp. TaxID=3041440 RepID=UPI00272E6DC4|nr:TolC family protein [Geoalkalibacter sp.]